MSFSYAVRFQAAPDCTTDLQGNFIADTIACTSLSIAHFQYDTRKVQKLLKNDLMAETAEQCISSTDKSVNGWDGFDALFRHCSGEGNGSRRIATADRLRETLHYKSENLMSLKIFLDRMQKMFNIFQNKGGLMADITQVREIFSRVQHPQLQYTVKALEVRSDLDGIKYSKADNHLTAAVSKILEYQFSIKVSGIRASGGNSGGNSCGGGLRKGGHNGGSIHNSQVNVHKGYYQNWKGLIKEYCKTLIAARKKKGSKSS